MVSGCMNLLSEPTVHSCFLLVPDPNESGFNIFDDVPTEIDCKAINEVPQTVPAKLETLETPPKVPEKSSKKSSPQSKAAASKVDANSPDDNDSDLFEIEESEAPLVPLYQLRDEGMHKWVLLSDLCYVLKVKSKDTLLKQVSEAGPNPYLGNPKILISSEYSSFAPHRVHRRHRRKKICCVKCVWPNSLRRPPACSCCAPAKSSTSVRPKWF